MQDVNDRWSSQYPQLYAPGQLNQYFSKMAFARILLHSCYSSLVLFFVPWAAMCDTVRDDGKSIADYQSFALLAQTCLLIAVSVQVNSHSTVYTHTKCTQLLRITIFTSNTIKSFVNLYTLRFSNALIQSVHIGHILNSHPKMIEHFWKPKLIFGKMFYLKNLFVL